MTSANEKASHLAHMLYREMSRLERETGVPIRDVILSRIDGRMTSVQINLDSRMKYVS